MRLLVAGLLAVGLSMPFVGTAHAAPPAKMSKSSFPAKPMRDPKTGRFLPKSAMASSKTTPMRDPKTGRFMKKGAMTSSKMTSPRKMPMRDAKGHFIKSPPQTTHKM